MSGRIYRLPFQNLSLGTNKQDLWALTTGAAMPCEIIEIRLDACATSIAELAVSLDLFTGSFTAGSGGSSATPAKTSQGDASAVTTAKLQNTTQTAVGTGTKIVLDAGSWQLVNGWAWQPLSEDSRIFVPVSACFVVSLDGTPASQNVSGCLLFRESF